MQNFAQKKKQNLVIITQATTHTHYTHESNLNRTKNEYRLIKKNKTSNKFIYLISCQLNSHTAECTELNFNIKQSMFDKMTMEQNSSPNKHFCQIHTALVRSNVNLVLQSRHQLVCHGVYGLCVFYI